MSLWLVGCTGCVLAFLLFSVGLLVWSGSVAGAVMRFARRWIGKRERGEGLLCLLGTGGGRIGGVLLLLLVFFCCLEFF